MKNLIVMMALLLVAGSALASGRLNVASNAALNNGLFPTST